jgi:hypothetical protein
MIVIPSPFSVLLKGHHTTSYTLDLHPDTCVEKVLVKRKGLLILQTPRLESELTTVNVDATVLPTLCI